MMHWVFKPKLRRTGTPETANRSFERSAPFLVSVTKGINAVPDGPSQRIPVGTPKPNQAILYLHGGAFVSGSQRSYRAMAGRLAKRTQMAVFLADYPLLQVAPLPAAPNAALAAWDHLIATGWDAHQIVIAGDSAAVLAFSPWTDLTLSGETLTTNDAVETLIPVSRMQETVDLYMDGADPAQPLASPLFANNTRTRHSS